MNMQIDLNDTAIQIGDVILTIGHVIFGMGVAALALLLLLLVAVMRGRGTRAVESEAADARAARAEAQVSAIMNAQSEMQGRLASLADVFGTRQSEMNETLQKRLDAMTSRIGQSMSEQQKSTHENLTRLQERLAVIDTAQNNIQSLAGQVVELQSILSDKQTRGAFGQSRMETIIADGLPTGSYVFQATLSNNSRPDCVISMPNDAPGLVIDAKFPLEGWNAARAADDPNERALAEKQFRRDMDTHIKDIAQKYLIAGETQDTAFMFVPSESIFADIHENHESIVQRAHKSRVVIVSPSLLMLSIQVIQALLKDVRMREQAHLIQTEVLRLMEDVGRLDDRVRKLQNHFGQASKDIDDVLVSSSKITKRGQRIEALEFDEPPSRKIEKETTDAAESKTGQLRLRVVDGDSDPN